MSSGEVLPSQWTGQKTLDKIVGLAGLVMLVALTVPGARLAFRRS